eukprot:scaffold111650_cov18-Tisochrysis_lutea.AAC.1
MSSIALHFLQCNHTARMHAAPLRLRQLRNGQHVQLVLDVCTKRVAGQIWVASFTCGCDQHPDVDQSKCLSSQ